MGATYTVHVDSKDSKVTAERVTKTMGCMADVTIECSGAESSVQTGIYVSVTLIHVLFCQKAGQLFCQYSFIIPASMLIPYYY